MNFLATVGKDALGISDQFLWYGFAKQRGLIHAHALLWTFEMWHDFNVAMQERGDARGAAAADAGAAGERVQLTTAADLQEIQLSSRLYASRRLAISLQSGSL